MELFKSMSLSRFFFFALSAIALITLASCTWVEVDERGYQVALISEERAASCEKIGSASTRTADAIGPFFRSERKIQEELIRLARNEAGALGGNAILPINKPWNGEQLFNVYNCAS